MSFILLSKRDPNANCVKHDDPMPCPKCGVTCIQNRTLYTDKEYRRCTRCGFRSEIIRVVGEDLTVYSQEDDRAKPDYDFKRTDPRTYRKREKKHQHEKKGAQK